MYLGKLCEFAQPDELYAAPAHPYTAALLSAIPEPDPDAAPPSAPASAARSRRRCRPRRAVGSGHAARTRGPMCSEEPLMREIRPGHFVACHHPLGDITVAETSAAETVAAPAPPAPTPAPPPPPLPMPAPPARSRSTRRRVTRDRGPAPERPSASTEPSGSPTSPPAPPVAAGAAAHAARSHGRAHRRPRGLGRARTAWMTTPVPAPAAAGHRRPVGACTPAPAAPDTPGGRGLDPEPRSRPWSYRCPNHQPPPPPPPSGRRAATPAAARTAAPRPRRTRTGRRATAPPAATEPEPRTPSPEPERRTIPDIAALDTLLPDRVQGRVDQPRK